MTLERAWFCQGAISRVSLLVHCKPEHLLSCEPGCCAGRNINHYFQVGDKAHKNQKLIADMAKYVVLICNIGCDETETFSMDWLQINVAKHMYLVFPLNPLWENRICKSSKLPNSWLVKGRNIIVCICFGTCLPLDCSMLNHVCSEDH